MSLFYDGSLTGLAAVTPTSTVVVHHARPDICRRETLALLVVALATPSNTTLRYNNLGLVYAVRKGQGHAIPWRIALDFF